MLGGFTRPKRVLVRLRLVMVVVELSGEVDRAEERESAAEEEEGDGGCGGEVRRRVVAEEGK